MGLRIHSSVFSTSLPRNLANADERVRGHFGRMSSGLRIASAADDPAGLGISERMRARIRAQTAALRNVDDAIGFVRTAEGGLAQISALLVSMRGLAVRALTGTLAPPDLAALEAEWKALAEEIKSVAKATIFNGQPVLGVNKIWRLQAGSEVGDLVGVRTFDMARLGAILGFFSLTAPGGPKSSLRLLDRGRDFVDKVVGKLGAKEHRLESIRRTLEQARLDLTGAESRVRDLDFAEESAALAGALIVQSLGVALVAQAKVQRELALELLETTLDAGREPDAVAEPDQEGSEQSRMDVDSSPARTP